MLPFPKIDPRIAMALVSVAMILGSASAILWQVNTAITNARDAGRAEVLLEIRERNVAMSERLQGADFGVGNVDEDLAWIDAELRALGVRPETITTTSGD